MSTSGGQGGARGIPGDAGSESSGLGAGANADASLDASPVGSCGPPTQRPAPCTRWSIAGSDRIVSEPYGIGDGGAGGASIFDFYVTSLVRSGNGALIAWTTWFTSGSSPVFWGTRALNIDGTPRSAIVSHTPFPVMVESPDNFMDLAVTPQCAFGALSYAGQLADGPSGPGCSFLPLDGDGNELGPAVWLGLDALDATSPSGNSGYCLGLGPAPDGFSYLQQSSDNAGTGDLVTVGSNGSLRLRKPLGTFPQFNPGRLVLDDESFLLSTFSQTDSANDYTWEVAHYDASGAQIAPGTIVAPSGNLVMAETSSGVLAVYVGSDPANQSGQALFVVPLSRDGVPTSTPVALPFTATPGVVYSFSLDPSPSGDVILRWISFDAPTNSYHVSATELDPGGGQRGPVLDFGVLGSDFGGHFLVSADGERALLVYSVSSATGVSSNGGVHTLPLACTAH